MPTRKTWDHVIDLKEMFKPWKGRIYSLSKDEREEVQKFVDDQLRKEYIRLSKFPQTSPVFFVNKKDRSKQMVIDKHIENIMEDASSHVHHINNYLKNIKSTLCTKFIWSYTGDISITTNNVPSSSDLTIIEQYFKSINSLSLTSHDITSFISYASLFESISLASKPRVIKASPKSDIAIVWIDI